MKHVYLVFLGLLMTGSVWAAGGGNGLMQANINLSDQASLQRGAKIFVNYCLSCHSAAYMRFNRLGKDLGIREDILVANIMFGTDKPGDTMTVNMSADDAIQYFGVVPPDLSVTARSRGADWLYTYFMTFYLDENRPLGVNNLAFKDVGMPHVLWEKQGWQKAVYKEVTEPDGTISKKIGHLELVEPGSESPEEYQQTVTDLVNFMVYLGEPIVLKRKQIGGWVIVYLGVLLFFVYLLKKEYWRDVH